MSEGAATRTEPVCPHTGRGAAASLPAVTKSAEARLRRDRAGDSPALIGNEGVAASCTSFQNVLADLFHRRLDGVAVESPPHEHSV